MRGKRIPSIHYNHTQLNNGNQEEHQHLINHKSQFPILLRDTRTMQLLFDSRIHFENQIKGTEKNSTNNKGVNPV